MNGKSNATEDLLMKFKHSVKRIATIIGCTYGPMGRNIAFRNVEGHLGITQCGFTALKQIRFSDTFERQPLSILQELCLTQHKMLGDGVTLSVILADTILSETVKVIISQGVDPIKLTEGIERAMQIVDKILLQNSRNLNNHTIHSISRTASKDQVLGDLIAILFKNTGLSYIEITAKINSKDEADTKNVILIPYDDITVNHAESRLLIWEEPILFPNEIKPLLEESTKDSSTLCIIAPVTSTDVKRYVDKIKMTLGISCILIDPPSDIPFTLWIRDIAILTGAKILSTVGGFALQDVTIFALIRIYNVNSSNGFLKFDFNRNKEIATIDEKIKKLQKIAAASVNDIDKKIIEARIKLLHAKIGYLNLSGHSQLELEERKRSANSAIHSVQAALQTGILPGGGIAFLHCITTLIADLDNTSNKWDKAGIEIMKQAMETPFRQLCKNAGYEADILIEKIKKNSNIGFTITNFTNVNTEDMEAFDSVTVLRESLHNAVKLTKTLIKTAHVVSFR